LNDRLDSSGNYVGFRRVVVREEVDIVLESPYSSITPNNYTRVKKTERNAESVPVSAFDTGIESTIEGVKKDSSEDVIVSDKNVKIVLQLPINSKKENIKVVANDDYSVTISYLDYDGKRCTRTLDIPYTINVDTAKATYKNGILVVTINR
jgi:HSP20 family molecular chaperone IbpA